MQFIDAGYQYNVYDLGNGKVLKQTRPALVTLYNMSRVYRNQGNPLAKACIKAFYFLKQSKETTFEIKNRLATVPPAVFGNPIFRNGISYEQAKVEIIDTYFKNHTPEQNKAVLNKYLELTHMLWSYGIHDYIYKFRANYGITQENTVALIDFNELTFSKDEALKSVYEKTWLKSKFYARWEESDLKKYYTEAMEREITPDKLKAIWGTKVENWKI